jgi:hypothetical protein
LVLSKWSKLYDMQGQIKDKLTWFDCDEHFSWSSFI